jgi:hypothetical protein
MSLVDKIDCDAGEKVLVIDLDIGNEPITPHIPQERIFKP